MEINQDNLNNSATTGIFPPSLKYVSSCHDFQPKNWQASHSDGSRVLGLPSSKVWEMKQRSPTGELAGLFHRHLLALLHAAAAFSPLASRNWLQPANSTCGQVDLLTSGCGPDWCDTHSQCDKHNLRGEGRWTLPASVRAKPGQFLNSRLHELCCKAGFFTKI